MNPHRLSLLVLAAGFLVGCGDATVPSTDSAADASVKTPTNRVPIPAAVRRNLGVTFATVEHRQVDEVLRVPGRFELLPTARRHHRAPLDGRVEVLVEELDRVEPGTPLYRLTGRGWFDLNARIDATRTRLGSMQSVREANRLHGAVLREISVLLESRLDELERLRGAEGDDARAATDGRLALNQAKADLARVLTDEAEIVGREQVLRHELASLEARRSLIQGDAECQGEADAVDGGLLVCATISGVVERIDVAPGAAVEARDSILSLVQPERIRVRGRVLQSDLVRVREGLSARIVAWNADAADDLSSMTATIRLVPVADGEGRTIGMIVVPESIAAWARPGVAVAVEVMFDGGRPELAIPRRAVVVDGGRPFVFRRDPADPDQAIRIEADLGRDDGRWVEILSGVAEGDEIVVEGHDQLLLAGIGVKPAEGHFHADGTFHTGDH